MTQHRPRSLVPVSSTAPRAHTLQSRQDGSLPPYPRSPQHPANSPRQAWCKHPSLLLAALPGVGSGRASRRQEPGSRVQSKSSSRCHLPPRRAMSPEQRDLTTPSQGHFHQSKVCTAPLAPSFFPLCSLHSFFFPSPDRPSSPTLQASRLGLEQSRNHYGQRLPYLHSISSLHRGKLRQGRKERARRKAEERQPRPGKGRHHPLHICKGDSSEEEDKNKCRAQRKPQPRCSYVSPSPAPGKSQQGRAQPHCGKAGCTHWLWVLGSTGWQRSDGSKALRGSDPAGVSRWLVVNSAGI